MLQPNLKHCLDCGKPVKGRSDKKFCDDYCRNHYNNEKKGADNNTVRNINNALRRNRQILAALINNNMATIKISKQALIKSGFRFNYITHQLETKKGNTYFFCYDYGYLYLNPDWLLIVKEKTAT